MKSLTVLFDRSTGRRVPLPRTLARFFGEFRLSRPAPAPYVVANFASTLDGVVSLDPRGRDRGGEITGFDLQDRCLMGILRATADAVVVGAGTLRSAPRHRWTADRVYPAAAVEYSRLRRLRRRPELPLQVVVSGSGRVDLTLPIFATAESPVLVVTSVAAARRLGSRPSPRNVEVLSVARTAPLPAKAVVQAVRSRTRTEVILVEGGPHLAAEFLWDGCLDEVFLTIAPQVAGREARMDRPGWVAGRLFAPDHPRWASLVAARRGERSVFLRYSFPRRPAVSPSVEIARRSARAPPRN